MILFTELGKMEREWVCLVISDLKGVVDASLKMWKFESLWIIPCLHVNFLTQIKNSSYLFVYLFSYLVS